MTSLGLAGWKERIRAVVAEICAGVRLRGVLEGVGSMVTGSRLCLATEEDAAWSESDSASLGWEVRCLPAFLLGVFVALIAGDAGEEGGEDSCVL